jgi:hypothetical protein
VGVGAGAGADVGVGVGVGAAAEVGTFGSASAEIEAARTIAPEPNDTAEQIARDEVMRGIRARSKKIVSLGHASPFDETSTREVA